MSFKEKIDLSALRDLPISRKLTLLILFTAASSLTVAGISIMAYEASALRGQAKTQLASIAQIVGDNTTGALAFNDEKSANENLAKLNDQELIVAARVFTEDGRPFATFNRHPNTIVPSKPEADGMRFRSGTLRLFDPIVLQGKRIGTLYMQSDLGPVRMRIWQYAGIVFLVILGLIPIVFFMSLRIQRVISIPIMDLATMAGQIASDKTYTRRAPAQSRDEIGQLTQTFNQMLDAIETRDHALHKANDELQAEINERKVIEQKLVQQAEELYRSNRELEQFAYVSSHDLQEPLRKVSSYAQLLGVKYKEKLGPEADKYINNVITGVSRMHNLIQDLLSYSRLSRPEIREEEVDLNVIAGQVISDLEPMIREKSASVKVEPLPTMRGNPSQFHQLLQNLVGNAIKFHGNKKPQVIISSRRDDNRWVISVEDNGIGIDSRYAEQIFKVFQRLHRRDQYPGTGIGLAICKKIVERLGGQIWVESEAEKGSTFRFTLPDQP